MASLAEGNVLTGSVGGVVGSMSVIGGHCMPEGSPCLADAVDDSSVFQHHIIKYHLRTDWQPWQANRCCNLFSKQPAITEDGGVCNSDATAVAWRKRTGRGALNLLVVLIQKPADEEE